MLVKVEVYNYLSHKETVLEFVPGTNVIIGLTDAGKSALFQAINWAITNRPLGDDFRSDWGGDTRVILHTTEGDQIERIRSASKNQYVINGKVLEAFGTEVPQEIVNLLQLDAANIQEQFDSFFLLSDTPGEAARKLNKAASIDDIDIATTNLKSAYREIDNNIKHNEREIKDKLEEMKQYEDIPTLEEKLQLVEKLSKEYQAILQNVTQLTNIISQVLIIQTKLDTTKDVLTLLEKQTYLQKKYDVFQSGKEKYNQLQIIIQSIENIQEELISTEYIEASLPLAQKVLNEYQDYSQKKQVFFNLFQLVNNVNKITGLIGEAGKEIETLEQQFYELSPDICPLCGNIMKKGHN